MSELRVLVVDDSSDDAALLLRELRKGGYRPSTDVVATRPELERALLRTWDAVVVDHNLPGFSGMQALALVREADPDVPVLLVSGSVGEEAAVAAMKAGAQDFILKDNLSRFVPAVERELRETGMRRRARLADETLHSTVELLARTVQGAIQTLAYLTETRDPYTAGHQRRVAELAGAMTESMGMNGERRRLIDASGTLHDLGKTAVPTEILSKPGRLTPAEFELIRAHPKTGHDILAGIEFPWPVADVVLQHHERLDGSGYPDGRAGDEIMLEARILGVADVVEAMSSHRPYRPALGLDQALAEIVEHRGVLYDADATDACVAAFSSGFVFT